MYADKLASAKDEHQLITKLYGPDPREKDRTRRKRDSSFVYDREDAALLGGAEETEPAVDQSGEKLS